MAQRTQPLLPIDGTSLGHAGGDTWDYGGTDFIVAAATSAMNKLLMVVSCAFKPEFKKKRKTNNKPTRYKSGKIYLNSFFIFLCDRSKTDKDNEPAVCLFEYEFVKCFTLSFYFICNDVLL